MSRGVVLGGVIVAMTMVVVATINDARTRAPAARTLRGGVETRVATSAVATAPVARARRGPDTSREQLMLTVKEMRARLASNPDDAPALVQLAGALLRLQRVNQDERSGQAALEHLEAFLSRHHDNYDARRLLAATLTSQHRFGDGIAEANALIARDPRDAWNYGILGDAYLELGDYDRAFAAFDRMGALQPGPPAYGRVAYALELKGDLAGALEYMLRAADGTTPNDAESQAWHYSQVGMLRLQTGKLAQAAREFERALATFPTYPLAVEGMARVRVAAGEFTAARKLYREQFARTPAAHLAAAVADLSAAIGDSGEAARYDEMAEQIERATWAVGQRQPQGLARLLAERNRDLPTALTLSEEAARRQRDIGTMDTLAWTYFKAGRFDDAAKASAEALRTGSRDARLLYHAAEIRNAMGERDAARELISRLPTRQIADVLLGRAITRLEQSLLQ